MMRSTPSRAIVAAVQPERVRIIVELEPGEPVCGSAARDHEPQIPFEGMLGFLSLFERLRTNDQPHDQARQPPTPDQ
jgi:hypothetical protein